MTIRNDDLVLEIGPGAYPHWRSDCLVDKFDNESCTDVSQFGGLPQKTLGKPLFRMDGTTIPFKDKSFDYVICSHVLEHVHHSDLPSFLAEIMRVGRRAYIEFPRTLYDFIYDFDVHLNLMDIVDGEIICLPKTVTRLGEVRRLSRYALEMRNKSGFSVELISPWTVAVGREFNESIPLQVYGDEEAFFARLPMDMSEYKKPGLSWKVATRINMTLHAFVKKHDREYFVGKLK
jgi:SAM-dependent methyltransferase